MPVVQKPTIKDPQDFISKAKTEKIKPTKEEVKQNVTQKLPDNSQKKNKRMTIYMTDDMYLKWKEYELTQLKSGKKVSFQGVIESYLKRLLK